MPEETRVATVPGSAATSGELGTRRANHPRTRATERRFRGFYQPPLKSSWNFVFLMSLEGVLESALGDDLQIRKLKEKRGRRGRVFLKKNSFMQHLFTFKAHSVIISAGLLEGLQRSVILVPALEDISLHVISALNQENHPGKGFIPSRFLFFCFFFFGQ